MGKWNIARCKALMIKPSTSHSTYHLSFTVEVQIAHQQKTSTSSSNQSRSRTSICSSNWYSIIHFWFRPEANPISCKLQLKTPLSSQVEKVKTPERSSNKEPQLKSSCLRCSQTVKLVISWILLRQLSRLQRKLSLSFRSSSQSLWQCRSNQCGTSWT